MGVPQFFHWLVTHYKDEILHATYSLPPAQSRPDYLYLDFNCGIHPAVKQPHLKDLPAMYEAVVDYLQVIVRQVRPKKLVYIAIDGVAPNAKMKQQRSRRFKAIQDKREKDVIDRKHKCWERSDIDYNMISPGTQFMHELSERLVNYITYGWKHDFPGLQVELSDASQPGEGEHKIMYHLRTQTNPETKVCIYGLDSDLIFLCLMNYRPGLCLFREKIMFGEKVVDKTQSDEDKVISQSIKAEAETKTPEELEAEKFTYLHVGALRKIILSILDPNLTQSQIESWGIMQPKDKRVYNDLDLTHDLDNPPDAKELAKLREMEDVKGVTALKERFLALSLGEDVAQRLIRDYVASTFVLGNDFLPHAPSLKIKEGGLNRVMEAYKEIQAELPGRYLVREDGQSFDYSFFSRFLEKLCLWEDGDLLEYQRASELRRSRFKNRFNYRTANPYQRDVMDWEYVEDKYKDTLKLGDTDWKDRYYQHYFGEHNPEKTREVVVNYLEGLIWMLRYYQGNGVQEAGRPIETCASWDWSYHYRAAPPISCLLPNLKPSDLDMEFTIGAPVRPHEQLLVILPPQSQALLPEELGRLMTGTESPLIHMYPTDFKIDLMGHRFRWECYPVLPDLDLDLIRTTLRQMESQRQSRDQLGSESQIQTLHSSGLSSRVEVRARF